MEGLLIEYLEPKLILQHDLTHSIIIFPRQKVLIIERDLSFDMKKVMRFSFKHQVDQGVPRYS